MPDRTTYDQVQEFHEAFGHPVNAVNINEPDGTKWRELKEFLEFRRRLIDEELDELFESLLNGDIENSLKEACDVKYVLDGTLVSIHGLPDPEPAPFAEVHRSNMSKLGEDGKPLYRDDGKVLKGPKFSPADMSQFFK